MRESVSVCVTSLLMLFNMSKFDYDLLFDFYTFFLKTFIYTLTNDILFWFIVWETLTNCVDIYWGDYPVISGVNTDSSAGDLYPAIHWVYIEYVSYLVNIFMDL